MQDCWIYSESNEKGASTGNSLVAGEEQPGEGSRGSTCGLAPLPLGSWASAPAPPPPLLSSPLPGPGRTCGCVSQAGGSGWQPCGHSSGEAARDEQEALGRRQPGPYVRTRSSAGPPSWRWKGAGSKQGSGRGGSGQGSGSLH